MPAREMGLYRLPKAKKVSYTLSGEANRVKPDRSSEMKRKSTIGVLTSSREGVINEVVE